MAVYACRLCQPCPQPTHLRAAVLMMARCNCCLLSKPVVNPSSVPNCPLQKSPEHLGTGVAGQMVLPGRSLLLFSSWNFCQWARFCGLFDNRSTRSIKKKKTLLYIWNNLRVSKTSWQLCSTFPKNSSHTFSRDVPQSIENWASFRMEFNSVFRFVSVHYFGCKVELKILSSVRQLLFNFPKNSCHTFSPETFHSIQNSMLIILVWDLVMFRCGFCQWKLAKPRVFFRQRFLEPQSD